MPPRYRWPLRALAFLLLAAPALRAQTYVDVTDPVGDPFLWGLAWHDGALYATDTNPERLVQIDLETGAVTEVAPLSFDPRGLAWDGANWRISTGFDSSDPVINTVDATGAVVGSIPAPGALTHGLAFHDGLLFAAQAYPDDEAALHGLDPADGSIEETVAFPQTQPGGVAFVDENTLWATNVGDDGSDVEELYQIDRTTGNVLQTLALPDEAGRPRGLAYDGTRYLYLVARQDVSPFEYVVYTIDLEVSGNPAVVVSSEALDFGARVFGSSYDLPITISNDGDGDLEITGVTITGPGADAFSTSLTDVTVAPGGQRSETVTFSPADFGPRAATLTFETNDVAQPTVTVTLDGTGVYAEQHVAFVEDSHDFGEVRVDGPQGLSAVRWPLRVVNAGAEPLTVTGVTTSDPSFAVLDGAFPVTVATLDTLTLEVEFRPAEVRAYDETATVASDDASNPEATVALQGEGILPDLAPGTPLWSLTTPDNPNTVSDEPKLFSIVVPGDLTGDGVPDLVFASANYLTFAVDGNGWGTPTILWQFNSCPSFDNCGAVSGNLQLYEYGMTATGDLDGDGVPDVVIGTEGGHDHVAALSGATGLPIWEVGDEQGNDPYLAGYYSVSARLDATGDGVPDVATGTGSATLENSPNPYNHRRVYLLDGATGAEQWVASPGLPSFRTLLYETGGEALVVAGGGEGTSHFLTAWRASDGVQQWTLSPGYSAFIIEPYPDGDDEDLLFHGAQDVLTSGLERRDGDDGAVVWASLLNVTIWDVAVFDDGTDTPKVAVGTTNPFVYALNGDDGEVAWTYDLADQVFSVATVPDADGDGAEDVAAVGKGGQAVLLSGADGSLIWSYSFGNGTFDQAGEVAAAVPDVDWNGVPEVAFGTRDGRGFLLFGGGGTAPAPVENPAVPDAFALLPAYPNPFAATATLRYHLPEPASARLAIYDLLGREVWTHTAEHEAAGTHSVAFDGRGLASGVYVVRFEAGGTVQTQRMTLVR